MKRFFQVFLSLVLAPSVFALPPTVSLDSLQAVEKGTNQLVFTFNGKTLLVRDDDGGATLATLTYMLLQKPSDELFSDRAKWEKLKTQKVQGWDIAGRLIEKSIASLVPVFQNLVKETTKALAEKPDPELLANLAQFQSALSDLEKLKKTVDSFENEGPSYEQFNAVGAWLDKYSELFSYNVTLKEGDQPEELQNAPLSAQVEPESPLASILSGMLYTVPSPIRSKSKAIIQGDLKKLLDEYKESER